MKKIVFFMGVCALMLGMNACKSESSAKKTETEAIATGDNSRTSIDWPGTYQGTLPCADCSGIETVIRLNSNNSYEMTTVYKGKGEEDVHSYGGSFEWTSDGGSIILSEDGRKLKVGENKLFWLDDNGKVISGQLAPRYILEKLNSDLVEKYWKLTEIFGEPIKEGDMTNEAFIVLRVLGNKMNGCLGCNSFFGTYELKGENQIKFSEVGSTMMMCGKMDVENKMKQVLEQADNYYVNGDNLTLNRARMAPLARFVAVYM